MRRKGQVPSEYGHSSVSSSILCAALRHGCSHGQLFCHCQIGRIRKTPVKASADSPKCFWESRRSCGGVGTPPPTMRCCEFAGCGGHPKRPHPFPPPAGEGAAHKGGRRGRTWRDRNVEMTATGGVCNEFYRLQAVTFSIFRHPPRGGSADATFPRRGKEMTAADSPDVALVFGAAARRAGVGAPYNRRLRIRRGWCLSLALLPGRRDAAPYHQMLRIRRGWRLAFGVAAEPATGWTTFPTNPCFHASMGTVKRTG